MADRWIVLPVYDPQGTPPITGREAQVRVGAIHLVEEGPALPNPDAGTTGFATVVRTPAGSVTTMLTADEVVALIEEALDG